MLYNYAFMKFDVNNNKEYIYSQKILGRTKPFVNNIGQTFIDFLANSDNIIKVIENGIDEFFKESKLKDISSIFTTTKTEIKLKKLSIFFDYFNFDYYLEDYLNEIRDNNKIKILKYLDTIKNFEEKIKYYNSKAYYKQLIIEELFKYNTNCFSTQCILNNFEKKLDIRLKENIEKNVKNHIIRDINKTKKYPVLDIIFKVYLDKFL